MCGGKIKVVRSLWLFITLFITKYFVENTWICGVVFQSFFFFFLSREWASRGEGQRERKKENLKQAPHPVQSPTMSWSHHSGIVPWAKIKSWTLNCLSHPGTPCGIFLSHFCQQWAAFAPVDLTVISPWIFIRNRISWLSLLNRWVA